ncbi:MAG: Gfo/Idh/MocA family oxidoreductase [Bacteroidetes bacterium]|nr:MAG: Gfo/Idh/MocA family oxidoreductase [Bacteroidota bacterium]
MIRLGIIGTGSMADVHAEAFDQIEGVQCTACCDLDLERASLFAKKFKIPNVYSDSSELINDDKIDAVSIVTSDRSHSPIALEALSKRLHVFCEKPLATSVADADRMVNAAHEAGVIHMVNFSYRRSSALLAAKEMVESGEIGRLLHVEAHYLQSWLVSKAWGDWREDDTWLWRLSTNHGSGGVLGDIGVHMLDLVTYCAGNVDWLRCDLRTFNKAQGNQIGEYELDANDSAVLTLSFQNGALGTLSMSRWATGHLNSIGVSLHGDKGAIRIDLDRSYETLECCIGEDVDEAIWRATEFEPAPSNFERFVHSIQTGVPEEPGFDRGAYVQKLLDSAHRSDAKKEPIQLNS